MMTIGPKFLARADYIFGLTLASLHLALCYWVFTSATEGSWGGFLVFLADIPISIPLTYLARYLGISALIVGGTVWWFCVGLAFSKAAKFLISRLSARGYI
jgi:hypothetical protein